MAQRIRAILLAKAPVDQQGPEVSVAAFADAAEASLLARGVLAGRDAEPGRQVPTGREAIQISRGGSERARTEQADPGHREPALNELAVASEDLDLPLELELTLFQLSDRAAMSHRPP
jgi:hypothetical protein